MRETRMLITQLYKSGKYSKVSVLAVAKFLL